MLSITFKIIETLSQFLLFFYYMLVMSQISQDIKFDWTKKLKLLATSAVMVVFALLLRGKFPLNTILLSATMFLSLAYLIKIKKSKASLIALLIPVFLVISEILLVVSFSVILKMPATEMILHKSISLAISLGTSLFLAIAVYIFNKMFSNKQKIKDFFTLFNRKYLKLVIFVFAFTMAPQALMIPLNSYNYNPVFLVLNFIELFAVSIFLIWYISNLLEKEKIQDQVRTLEMDNKTLGGMVDGVRTIKHDFNNIFQAINGYICSKQYDELEKYILKVMKECNIVNTLSIINKNVFDDPANYGVIGSKYFIATESNIAMDLDVTVSFKNINFPMPELSRILGILLDNAIEATSKCENKYIRLEIKYVSKKNATVIRILNTYDQSVQIDLSNIYNKGYSTKKIKSGLGLWEACKIISRHRHSQIYATIENEKFVQNIIIENT